VIFKGDEVDMLTRQTCKEGVFIIWVLLKWIYLALAQIVKLLSIEYRFAFSTDESGSVREAINLN
jgi:hypothetical protein